MRSPRWDNVDENTEAAWSKPDVHKHTDCAHKQEEGVLRCRKSGRLRRINRLRPDLKRFYVGEDEEDLIIKLHALLGNRWSLIAGRLPGRTDDQIKNYWNTHLKRKLVSLGIDPDNHRPSLRIDLRRQGSSRECAEHKDLNSEANNDETSDGTSCLGDNSHCGLPDLNLNLTISTSSSSFTNQASAVPRKI